MTDKDLPAPMRAFLDDLVSDAESEASSPAVVQGVADIGELVLGRFADFMAENGYIFASVAQPLADGQHRLSHLTDPTE